MGKARRNLHDPVGSHADRGMIGQEIASNEIGDRRGDVPYRILSNMGAPYVGLCRHVVEQHSCHRRFLPCADVREA